MKRATIYIINRENVDWFVNKSGIPLTSIWLSSMTSSFKSYGAKRREKPSESKTICKKKRIVGLTGHPSSNGLMDLWAEFRVLDLGSKTWKVHNPLTVSAYFVPG